MEPVKAYQKFELDHETEAAATPAPVQEPTTPVTAQARELVEHFYQRFHGTTHSTSKAHQLTFALIAQHGIPPCLLHCRLCAS